MNEQATQFPQDSQEVEEGVCSQCGAHADEPCDPQCDANACDVCTVSGGHAYRCPEGSYGYEAELRGDAEREAM